ncbi:MAG TPA: hypothetical protein DDZ43_11415, partial [Hyphomonadaceae bacterium]|nr:hypothetical protein [Hyphomonadaceae bacterium]
VGQLGLALAVSTPLSMLFGLSLRSGVATDVNNTFPIGFYVRLRSVVSVLIVIVAAAIAFVFFDDVQLSAVIVAVACVKAVEGASELSYGVAQRSAKLQMISISYLLRSVLAVSMFGGAIYFSGNILWAAIAWFVSGSLVYMFYDLRHFNSASHSAVSAQVENRASGERLKAERSGSIWALVWVQLPLAGGAA